MIQPLAITRADGLIAPAAHTGPGGVIAPLCAVDGVAPCCCDDTPPVSGDWCFVQIFRCSCWDVSQSRWFPAHRLYVDGQIKPVYVIDGQCWYTGRAVVLTPNFIIPEYPPYIGDIGPGVVGPWFESCAAGGCTTNQCPCVGANRLWTSLRNTCGQANVQVCARYVTLAFSWNATRSEVSSAPSCPPTTVVSSSSASGIVVFDIFANQVVSAEIFNTASASGTAPDGVPGNPCRTRQVAYNFARTIGPTDTFGIFNASAWDFFTSVMSGSFNSRNNGFGAATGTVPVLDPNRSSDHDLVGYQPPSGVNCQLSYSQSDQFGSQSHTAARNPFSESVSWNETGSGYTASGSRSYSLSFSATVPDIQPANCPGAVLGFPCRGGKPVGIDVAATPLNAADFSRVAVVDGACYTPLPDVVDQGVAVTQWVPNCSDPACGDGPPPPGGGPDDDGPDGGEVPDGPGPTVQTPQSQIQAQYGCRGCGDPGLDGIL